MTGLAREIRRRQRHAAHQPAPAPSSTPGPRCSAGNDPARCCVGDPWADFSPYDVEPLPSAVIRVAAQRGVDPHALDQHVEAIHGWEPHDAGYGDHVAAAADCLLAGGCE